MADIDIGLERWQWEFIEMFVLMVVLMVLGEQLIVWLMGVS